MSAGPPALVRKRLFFALLTSCFLSLSACAGHQQSAVDPAGPQSGRIATLWWFFLILLSVIFVVVVLLALWILTRPHRESEGRQPLGLQNAPPPAVESRLQRIVTGAVVATVLILFVLIFLSVGTGRAIADLGYKKNGLTIQVTGNQWWWRFEYKTNDPSRTLVTANEIHIPVGRPVLILGQSNDVIHSFWVPNLHGKRDLIPSRATTEWIEADKPGIYRGQCAEFCGLQHAHMAFYVIAEPEDKYEAWMQAQLQPAVAPADPVLQRGQQVFMNHACLYCHQIRGTSAAGQNAPDLTHLGSRRSIAAGTLPNTLGNLGGWIVNPQSIKPGNHMATIAVNPEDLQPLIEYLESLK